MGVRIHLQTGRYQDRDNGQFASMVEAATNQAAYTAARQGAAEARGILGERWGGAVQIDAVGGGGEWEIEATGQWAEAAEFGIPAHPIDTEKWSMYNPAADFPRVGRNGKRIQVQHVNHPGTLELRMIETAGDMISHEFEGILVSYLP